MNNLSVMDNRDTVDWNLEIDRVVIEGIPLTSYQQMQLMGSLEAELGRLFSGKGMPRDVRTIQGRITGAPVELRGSGSAPVELGKQIAATVFKSLSGE